MLTYTNRGFPFDSPLHFVRYDYLVLLLLAAVLQHYDIMTTINELCFFFFGAQALSWMAGWPAKAVGIFLKLKAISSLD